MHKRDVNGLMPVHVAAASENVHALRALLELDPNGMVEDLKDAKNKDGMTPLEGLESSMRSTREFVETLLGAWNGYSDEGLSCEYLLKKAMSLPLPATEAEYIKKRRLGSQCTCGMCTDGWLSPRMRFRLLGELLSVDGLFGPWTNISHFSFFLFVSSPSRNSTRYASYGPLLLQTLPTPLRF